MKQFILLVICALFVTEAYSQNGIHNYFSQTTGDYIQVGYGQNYILFRYPSPGNQFVRLNYISSDGGKLYYGNSNFQVVIANNSTQICVCTPQYANWYNYCGPVPTSDSFTNSGSTRKSTPTTSKCPWCNGTGRIAKDDHVTHYTSPDCDLYVKCGECGITYNRTYRNHYHLNCSKCGGTGKLVH